MDSKDFQEFTKATADFLINYLKNTPDNEVLPSVKPGYLLPLLPKHMPENSENWESIFQDFENLIMPGVTHWQSPNFHAYFPTLTSYPSIIGEMMSAGLGVLGFNWLSSPACTELEMIVVDWLAKFFNLPDYYLHSHSGPGGGAMQGSASEAILVTIVTAREAAVARLKQKTSNIDEKGVRNKLIVYCSEMANHCIEKAAMIASVSIRMLPTENFKMTGQELEKAIKSDILDDEIPCICITTLGTTGTSTYDDIVSLAEVCQKYSVWLHVDAAYSGCHLALPEYNHELSKGLDQSDSLNINLSKNLPINFDSAVLWMKDSGLLKRAFTIERDYMQHKYEDDEAALDLQNWQIPVARRFRALKIWFTLRSFGAVRLRSEMENRIRVTDLFAEKVMSDLRFELVAKSHGLVCFRVKGENELTEKLLDNLLIRKRIYLHKTAYKDKVFLRFCACGYNPKESDIEFAWKEISEQTQILFDIPTELKVTNGRQHNLK